MIKIYSLKKNKVVKGVKHDLDNGVHSWLDIVEPKKQDLELVCSLTGLHTEDIKAWLNGKRRPVSTDLEKHFLLVMHIPCSTKLISTIQPCIFLISKKHKNLITMRQGISHVFHEVENYAIDHKKNLFAGGPSKILAAIITETIDSFHELAEEMSELIDKIEKKMFSPRTEKNLMQSIFIVKQRLIYLQKSLVTNRNVVARIVEEKSEFIMLSETRQFAIIERSLTQLIEITSTYREILNSATEIHLTTISNSLNTTMKKITSWGAIILIPSLITGFYGMNFQFFPGLKWQYGIHFAIGLMIGSVALLYYYFKKKDWI
jgi:magnesium transporter